MADDQMASAHLSSATFASWVGPHLPVLSAIAVREVGAADADDLVQESLVRAWRRRSTFDPARGSPRSWLVAVLLDRARRHRVRRRPDVLTDADPHEPSDGAERRLDLERAITSLPTRQRQVITLFYLADLPVTEVAIVLGLSAGSVKSYLHEARTALRTRLEES